MNYSVDLNGCWIWKGPLSSTGYGHIQLDGRGRKRQMAHRWVYETNIGPIAAGHDLDHLCRVPACVNPAHLEPVLPAVNCQRGKRAKLTADDVAEIRATYAAGTQTQTELAARFGVHSSTVSRITRGERWPIRPEGRRAA